MMTVPPIVGVPRLIWCDEGPSIRISWPSPARRKALIAIGVARIDTTRATTAATRIDFTGSPFHPSARNTAASCSSPTTREPSTSTTSPGSNEPAQRVERGRHVAHAEGTTKGRLG